MKFRSLYLGCFLTIGLLCVPWVLSSCSGNKRADTSHDSEKTERRGGAPGGPRLGTPGGGPVIDKSADSVLQAMIRTEVPQFRQLVFKDETTGKSMNYNLFVPKNAEPGESYPLVLFIADASIPGDNVTLPLTQGYGALVWANDRWQAAHPCFVLVPQFSGVAVNDAYEHTDEVDIVIRMLAEVVDTYHADRNRLYTTGQSMGGMISMYYNVAYPDVFAASIFVDSHWATDTFGELARHKFVYFIAGDKGKAYTCLAPLEEACRADSVQYTFAAWSARLPEERQSEIASTMLDKGAPVNIFEFENGTVLPADGRGSEHMYSFDYAYKVSAVREWLFRQSK